MTALNYFKHKNTEQVLKSDSASVLCYMPPQPQNRESCVLLSARL